MFCFPGIEGLQEDLRVDRTNKVRAGGCLGLADPIRLRQGKLGTPECSRSV